MSWLGAIAIHTLLSFTKAKHYLIDMNESEIASNPVGTLYVVATHAKNDTVRAFYEHFGFIQSPTDPLHLFVLTKDLRLL
jgi:hypothetical protein